MIPEVFNRMQEQTDPRFDAKDAELLAARVALWDARTGPRVGDFLELPDGGFLRFTHDWGDEIQTTVKGADASFYLYKDGFGDFSGSLDKAIPKVSLVDTGHERAGRFWFFHHDDVRAHNGVHASVLCRVYRADIA